MVYDNILFEITNRWQSLPGGCYHRRYWSDSPLSVVMEGSNVAELTSVRAGMRKDEERRNGLVPDCAAGVIYVRFPIEKLGTLWPMSTYSVLNAR